MPAALDIDASTATPDDATTKTRPQLANLTPLEQMKAGHMPRRFAQLMVGLSLYGIAMGMFVRAQVGLDPWDVFHMGVSNHTGLGMGTITIIVSFVVLLLWIPLRQWPGLGTVMNSIWIGLALTATMAVLSPVHSTVPQYLLFAAGLVVNGLGGALYIGAQLGPGPRDGLMTGLHRRTGLSLRVIRTGIEVTVLIIGWLLGGVVGIGTVIYALAIGPLVQFFLPYCTVRLSSARVPVDPDEPGAEAEGH